MLSADSNFCEGESLVLSTDELIGLQYVWFRDDIAIAGATTNTYETTESGTYHVEIFDYCNPDSLPSNMVTITVNTLPIVNLSLDATVLTATQDVDYSYIWYLDGDELPVTNTEYQYTALENGEYWVAVTDENGCEETSNSQTVSTIVGIEDVLHGMEVFPNPTEGKIYFTLKKDIVIRRLIVTNVIGEVIFDQVYNIKDAGEKFEFDISDQTPGIYIVNIKSDIGYILYKLVKQ